MSFLTEIRSKSIFRKLEKAICLCSLVHFEFQSQLSISEQMKMDADERKQKQFGYPLDTSMMNKKTIPWLPQRCSSSTGRFDGVWGTAGRSWHCIIQEEKFQSQNVDC